MNREPTDEERNELYMAEAQDIAGSGSRQLDIVRYGYTGLEDLWGDDFWFAYRSHMGELPIGIDISDYVP